MSAASPRASAPPKLPDPLPARPQPVPRQSDPYVQQSVKDFETFISFILSISIFGASTFAIIAGQMADPADLWKPDPPPFYLSTVRVFLGIAWLCFVLALAVAGYSSSILVLRRRSAHHIQLDIHFSKDLTLTYITISISIVQWQQRHFSPYNVRHAPAHLCSTSWPKASTTPVNSSPRNTDGKLRL